MRHRNVVIALFAGCGGLLLAAPDAARADDPVCRVSTELSAPSDAQSGTPVSVELVVKPACRPLRYDTHAVFVLVGLRQWAHDSTDAVRLVEHTASKWLGFDDRLHVGAVTTGARPRSCRLSQTPRSFRRCLTYSAATRPARNEPAIGADIAAGVRSARRMLATAKASSDADGVKQVAIIVASGPNRDECETARREVRRLTQYGALVITAEPPDRRQPNACLRELATSPRYHFLLASASSLDSVFRQLSSRVISHASHRTNVTLSYHPGIPLLPGRSVPPATSESVADRQASWSLRHSRSVTVTFEVMPLQTGRQPLFDTLNVGTLPSHGAAILNPVPAPVIDVR